jgi:hypothetical protein
VNHRFWAPILSRRFQLRHLFAATAALCAVLAAGRWYLPAGVLVGYAIFYVVAERMRSVKTVVERGVFLGIGMLLVALSMPPIEEGRREAHARLSRAQARQIMGAIQLYHSEYGVFPPAYTVDPQGRPLLSWRVLLLPYLEEHSLYEEFHFDEPWDSLHNRPLAARMPRIFHSPLRGMRRRDEIASYAALVGADAVWQERSESSAALAILEWPESDVVWTEPRDYEVTEFWRLTHPPGGIVRKHLRHPGETLVIGRWNGDAEPVALHRLSIEEQQALLRRP